MIYNPTGDPNTIYHTSGDCNMIHCKQVTLTWSWAQMKLMIYLIYSKLN